jgi:hypothetical protein
MKARQYTEEQIIAVLREGEAGSDLLGGPKMITIILASVAAVIVILISLISPTVRHYRLSQGIASIPARTPHL